MKYSKTIRAVAISLALSVALPGQVLAAVPDGTVVSDEIPGTGIAEVANTEETVETPAETEPELTSETTLETTLEITPESEETETDTEAEETDEVKETEETETAEETSESTETSESSETKETETIVASEETESTAETEAVKETEAKPAETEAASKVSEAGFSTGSFLTSEQFSKVQDRIQYNVTVPIEGLPSFITQEMVVGALKCQDESGFPASVTIAQIIQESGFASYGPGGEDGEGLSYLAYQYCNLFGIKGTGTAGTVNMSTLEMSEDGTLYTDVAGFRAYHTYTEAIQDRQKILEEGYSDLIEGVNDANTFAMRISGRWATGADYGQSLIKIMTTYDLYRLDDMTLVDFSQMIGRFANPCPGSTITSTFGFRSFDNAFHKGLDLGTGSENIPTYAADDGVVIQAGYSESAGNWVVIDHGDGLVTKYMHHAEIYVEVGQEVSKGQQIGLSGTTGDSTGNHLHFQVEENGVAVDPMLYLLDEGNGDTVKLNEASAAAQKSKNYLGLLLSNAISGK